MRKRTLLLAAAGFAFSVPAMAQQGLNAGPLQPLLNLFASSEVGADTFVQQAAFGDAFEMESSRILLNGSQHPNIRQFAETMIQHHTQLTNTLRSVPEGATRIPVGLDERRARLLAELRQHEGDMLDRHYVAQQIQSHEESELLYRTYAETGDVPLLKAFAQQNLPMIREHLRMARALQAPGAQQ